VGDVPVDMLMQALKDQAVPVSFQILNPKAWVIMVLQSLV